jgi:hypothetical protein
MMSRARVDMVFAHPKVYSPSRGSLKPMQKTAADIREIIAQLRANAVKYLGLAEERRKLDQVRIADKLLEYVGDLEAKAAQLEASLPPIVESSASPAASGVCRGRDS